MEKHRTYQAHVGDSLDLDPASPFFWPHVSRYWWASEQAKGARVLDCACGKGYGSYVLSHTAKEVVGVDLNDQSLAVARKEFPDIPFVQQSIFQLGELGRRFDLIVAFEVIEHIRPEATDEFLQSLAAALAPGGQVLISTPNHEVVTKSGAAVPDFHINNFRARELRRALAAHFQGVEMLGQFRQRGRLNQFLFDHDYLNLRHMLPKRRAAAETPTPAFTPAEPARDARPFLDHYPEEAGVYRFSPGHWRQAGMTVARCRWPRAFS